jgi:dCTP deaminase
MGSDEYSNEIINEVNLTSMLVEVPKKAYVWENMPGTLNDLEIKERVKNENMIENFVDRLIRYIDFKHPYDKELGWVTERKRIISYGLTSVGYDIRLAPKYKVFSNLDGQIIDPLDFDDSVLVEREGPFCIIPPNSYILGHTIEAFNMPDDVHAICFGKSSYARIGIAVNVTPLEPGWKGTLVLEIANHTPIPAKVYANMGIAQLMFMKNNVPKHTYANRPGGPGKYQGQTGITTIKL